MIYLNMTIFERTYKEDTKSLREEQELLLPENKIPKNNSKENVQDLQLEKYKILLGEIIKEDFNEGSIYLIFVDQRS